MEDEKKIEKTEAEVSESDLIKQENASYEAGIEPKIVNAEITDEVKQSFLDYAMSVIVSRAIPDVRDGFKPVHRRVIYSMYEKGYMPDKPHVKCAKVVGDVMGNYHPHGDSAIYETLVRMAQNFSLRYPLVDGHGNFGNMDGDDAAAYRYTESRLNKLSKELVRDIECNTVDFVDNYDGSLQEPSVLPCRFPNLLVNGSDGIAVGMATKMPSHNLGEVIDAIIAYSKNKDISIDELMKYVKGPDFATGGIIYGINGIKQAYETGKGTFKIRAKAHVEEEANGKSRIVITEIPYQVRKGDLVAKIGELARNKKIEGITSIKDFSKSDVHIVIELRRDVSGEVILNKLYKETQLEVSFGIINLCIVDGAPKILSLKELIKYYLDFQMDVVRRRTIFLKAKDEARINILNALLTVSDNVNEVTEMAKSSKSTDDFKEKLMVRYSFNEEQAKAVVGMTLGRLTGLENEKINDEKSQLLENVKGYNYILEDESHVCDLVISELQTIKNKFNDPRKSEISSMISSVEDEDLIPKDSIVITLTSNGYIKRVSSKEFKSQNRGGIGVKGMTIYAGDVVTKLVNASTHTDILFFSNTGKTYRKRGHEINEGSRQSKGIPVSNLLKLEKGENIVSILPVDDYTNKYLLFMTKQGICKRTPLEEFININCNGKRALNFKEDDSLLDVEITDGNSYVLVASKDGQLCMFKEDEIRAMGRTASGVKSINLKGSEVIGVDISSHGDKVLVLSEKGLGKLSSIDDYRITHRGSSGVKTIKITEKTGSLVAMKVVKGDEDYLAITLNGTVVRSNLEQVRECGRNSIGVKLIDLREKDVVTSLTCLEKIVDENVEENKNETTSEE